MTVVQQPRSSGTPLGSDRAGFTLIEALVIVVLVSLLAAVAAPNIDRVDFQLKAAARELVTRLAAAKHMAVLKQHDVVLGFDVDDRRIRVHSDRNSNGSLDTGEDVRFYELPTDVAFGRGGAAGIGGLSQAMNLTQSQDGFPSLTFHRNGAASQEARIHFTSVRAARSDGFPEDARALAVARATGTISCFSHETSTWSDGC